jgi:hypothetical protein
MFLTKSRQECASLVRKGVYDKGTTLQINSISHVRQIADEERIPHWAAWVMFDAVFWIVSLCVLCSGKSFT